MSGKTETLPRATQVLISGAGPVGLFAAVELGRRGVNCVVVEPRPAVTRARPRAKTLNTRTMEHLRRIGLAKRLRERAPLPTSWSQDISFCTSLLGDELARFTGVLGLADDADCSPELGQQLPQYILEEMLREVVNELPSCTMMLGARVEELRQSPDDVRVHIQETGGAATEITAEYVLGADGANSAVRKAIGSTYVGSRSLAPNLGMVFQTPDLDEVLTERPAVQYWLLNEQTPGLMGPIDLHGTWWLIAFGVDSTDGAIDPDRIIAGAVGKRLTATVLSTDPWTARMELVDRSRAGRVFLLGDAAHLNPPFGGHGLNTGLGDAVDLGWKIAARLQGWGGDALLDSYISERRPLHERVIEAATANNAVLSADLIRVPAHAPVSSAEAVRAEIRSKIHAAKAAEYFTLDLVLGHRYTNSPVICDSEARGPLAPDALWATTIRSGGRLPHVWLEPGQSTLDCVGPTFTLLQLGPADSAPLVRAADQAGMGMTIVDLQQYGLSAKLGAELVLVRPDQYIAWHGASAPADAAALLRRVAGYRQAETDCTLGHA